MKRAALPVVLLALLFVAYERTAVTQSRSVRQLAPGVFSRQGDTDARQPANTSWIEFHDFVVVIDANTPWGIRAILPEIKKTTSKPVRYVFDTHYHWDHSQGNSVMADEGVTVICSQDCASELSTKGKEEWASGAKRTDQYSLTPYRMELPSVVFDNFMAIDDGERRLELRRVGPAHTMGDAVAFLPKEGILFTGDLCVNWRSGNNVGDPDADHSHWAQVLNDMARLEPQDCDSRTRGSRHGGHAQGPERIPGRSLETGLRRKESGKDGRSTLEGSGSLEARQLCRGRAAEPVGDQAGLQEGSRLEDAMKAMPQIARRIVLSRRSRGSCLGHSGPWASTVALGCRRTGHDTSLWASRCL